MFKVQSSQDGSGGDKEMLRETKTIFSWVYFSVSSSFCFICPVVYIIAINEVKVFWPWIKFQVGKISNC